MNNKEYAALFGENSGEAGRGRRVEREGMEQEALFSWAEHMRYITPELRMLYHVPNGGYRNQAEAARLKRQGVKAGVPDLCLPVPRGAFHGLYIELKAEGGKTSKSQDAWLCDLRGQGYAAYVCVGWLAAKEKIEGYLKLK